MNNKKEQELSVLKILIISGIAKKASEILGGYNYVRFNFLTIFHTCIEYAMVVREIRGLKSESKMIHIYEGGGVVKTLRAKDIMNHMVLTVHSDWSVEQLADFLIENSISGVPVTSEEEKLVGVVSLTDIVRYNSLPIRDSQSAGPHEYYFHTLEHRYSKEEIASFRVGGVSPVTVREIMTRIVFNIEEDTKIQEVADAMIKGRIHRVFVTRDDKLTGIITSYDMLKIVRDL